MRLIIGKKNTSTFIIFLWMILFSSCSRTHSPSETVSSVTPDRQLYEPINKDDKPVYQIATVTIGGKKLMVEIADTPAIQRRGLMFRDSLAKNNGMLFIYEYPKILTFWMKNTGIPLSIGFFDQDGVLLEIDDMKPYTLYPQTVSSKPAKYALEVNIGWFKQNDIAPGARLVINQSSN